MTFGHLIVGLYEITLSIHFYNLKNLRKFKKQIAMVKLFVTRCTMKASHAVLYLAVFSATIHVRYQWLFLIPVINDTHFT